jgi:S1-C subfamily serine protease
MDLEDIVVKIKVKTNNIDYNHPLNIYDTSTSTGTGFFITNKLILTCYHVISNGINIEVIYKQTNIYNAKVKYIYPDDDFAIIELDKPIEKSNILKFKILNDKQNLKVYSIGYPLSSNNIIKTKGIISGFTNSYIQIDATINEGNSGGPLVIKDKKTKKLYVVGIIVSKYVGNNIENTNFAIPIYRFIITINYLINNPTLNIIKKPLIKFEYSLTVFEYQKINQDKLRLHLIPKSIPNYEYYIKNNIGILITKICQNTYLKNYLKPNDVLIKINGSEIDNLGNCKFNFYPEKININEIGFWFVENDIIEIEFINSETLLLDKKKLQFKIIKTNIYEYYSVIPNYPPYYILNNKLVLSIITNNHFNNEKFNLSGKQYFNILLRCKLNLFTVILSDISQNIGFNNYPLGDIIISINDQEYNNYKEFFDIISSPIIKFKTIKNRIYFI